MDKKKSSKSTIVCQNRRIEDSLSDRSKKLKPKLNQVKTKKIQSDLKESTLVPKISERSKRLASKSTTNLIVTNTRIKRTHELLKSSNLMPKKVKLSMANLNTSRKIPTFISKQEVRYDRVLTSPLKEEKLTFPSLDVLFDSPQDSIFCIPEDISNRNKMILALKNQENNDLADSSQSLTVHERSVKWLQNKNDKIQELREKSETLATECCTFRPTLKSKSISSASSPRLNSVQSYVSAKIMNCMKTSRLSSQKSFRDVIDSDGNDEKRMKIGKSFVAGNESVSPYLVNISRPTGYSETFKKKLRPVVNYGILNVRPYKLDEFI